MQQMRVVRPHAAGAAGRGSCPTLHLHPSAGSRRLSSSRRTRCLSSAQEAAGTRQQERQGDANRLCTALSQDSLVPQQQQEQHTQPSATTPASSSSSAAAATAAAAAAGTPSSRRQALTAAGATALASLACSLASPPAPAAAAEAGQPDLTVTQRVYFDVGVASSAFKPAGERMLGDKTVLPTDAEPAGRIVIGLYGNLAPATVSNLVAAVQAGAFTGSAFSKISPGEFLQLGKQGSRRMGDVEPPPGLLQPNSDLAAPGPFSLRHSRPGTVSLSLSENDEDPKVRERPDYRGLEFLITTGPGPVPRLDGLNAVFGRVEEGMDTVARLAQVPSFQPDIRSQQLNRFAAFIGDERADNVRRQYGRPLKAIVVLGSGVLPAAGANGGGSAAGAARAKAGALALSAGSTLEMP